MGLYGLLILLCLALLVTVNATLKCDTINEKEVVCKPRDSSIVLRRGLVSDNNITTKITLKACRITQIDFEAFENDFNLQYIDLSENEISSLELGVLDENRQVTYLNLSHNLLRSFPLGLFDHKVNIEVLDLKGNKIENLELGIFDKLSKLAHVDLSSNALIGKNMNPYIFDRSRRITYIDFSGNNMSEFSDVLLHAFEILDTLKLDKCSLTEVPSFATRFNLRTLKNLVLSANQITSLSNSRTFMNLHNLEVLNLAQNHIEEVSADVFSCCVKKLKTLVLRSNLIHTLSEGLFTNLNRLGNLDLSQNYITYVPLKAFRGSGLKNLNLSYNKFTYLEANFCLELKNSGVSLNKFYVNDNPWQCACYNEVLKEMKKYSIRYNSNKLNGVTPVCVTTGQFTCKRQRADNEFYVQMYEREILNAQQ